MTQIFSMRHFARRLEELCKEPSVTDVIRVVEQTPEVQCRPAARRSGAIALRLGMRGDPTWPMRLDTALIVWRDETLGMPRAKAMIRRALRRVDTHDVLFVTPHPEHEDLVRQLNGRDGYVFVAVVRKMRWAHTEATHDSQPPSMLRSRAGDSRSDS